MWTTEPVKPIPQPQQQGGRRQPGVPGAQEEDDGQAGPSAQAMDAVLSGIDMPEDISSPMQANPAQQARPTGQPAFGTGFKEKLRRRRLQEYSPTTGV